MIRAKILLVGDAVQSGSVLGSLEENWDVVRVASTGSLSSIPVDLRSFDVVWFHIDSTLDHETAMALSPSQILITTSTGLTHVASSAQRHLGDRLISLRGESELLALLTGTVELAWALLLNASHKIPSASGDVKAGYWRRNHFFRQKQLSSSSLGIIGYGRLGRIAAQIGQNIVRDIVIFDPAEQAIDQGVKDGRRIAEDQASLFERVDFVMIHASSAPTPAQNLVFDSESLSSTGRPFHLVNTSRGNLVDEAVVVEGLKSGKILSYSADVLSVEDSMDRLDNSPVWCAMRDGLPVFLTPHLGGASLEAMEMAENHLLRILEGRLAKQS